MSSADQLARELARRARRIEAAALTELRREQDPLLELAHAHLVPQEPEALADTLAQTLTFGLLAARWLGRDRGAAFTRRALTSLLPTTGEHLRELFDHLIDGALAPLLDDVAELLARTAIAELFGAEQDPTIHFYQRFLDAYDPSLRRRMGVYSTPDAIVEAMVAQLDQLARARLGLRLGLADPIRWGEYAKLRGIALPRGVEPSDFVVQILDPATGTGTFLLRAIERIFATMTAEYAALGYDDAAAAAAWTSYVREALLPRLRGFELMLAPYVVAHLRLGLALERGLAADSSRDVARWGVRFGPRDRLRVSLTNALELDAGPERGAPLIILGNPPYERISADADATADWLRRGKVPGRASDKSLFDDIRDVAREHTIFSHLRSLPDRYVYFWRWALWRVFESSPGPGIVALISNSTWLSGPGFVGLRKIAREQADAIWTIDLGGDQRGASPDPNVFEIETPVAITIMLRDDRANIECPADSRYCKIDGISAFDKLHKLQNAQFDWTPSPSGWLDSFVPPTGGADWLECPALADLFPWQQPGCLASRTWPIAPARETLALRWRSFVGAPVDERPELFATAKTGRNIYTEVPGFPPLASLDGSAAHEPIVRYGFRSFDRQWILADPRLLKTEAPSLWRSRSDRQLFLCSLVRAPLGPGPAMTVTCHVPDFHHFCGRGGKDTLPLFRDADATQPNVTRGLLAALGERLGIATPSPEQLAAYVYAILSSPSYQSRFGEALATPGPRVPITSDATLWARAVALGMRLLWLHTYAERCRDPAAGRGDTLPRVASLAWISPITRMPERPSSIELDADDGVLAIADGRLAGVDPRVWEFGVSGMPVVKKWLGYRTRRGAGKAASSRNPLDAIRPREWPSEWSVELVELLTVLTLTLELEPAQASLLGAICEGPRIAASALPRPGADERREPGVTAARGSTRSRSRRWPAPS